MINFIICDDVKKYRNMIKNVIDRYMMKNKLEYKTYEYNDYDNNFMKIVNKRLSNKIYILDIEAPTRSGIDVARIIRKKDKNSVLIFLTGHEELASGVSKSAFLFLTFINKFDECEKQLYSTIDEALKVFNIKQKIEFKEMGFYYSIPLDDIMYITRDSIERKCVIVTDYCEFKIGKTLNEIENYLSDNFVKTHRACFINKSRVIGYNKVKKIAIFDNGKTCNLISTRFKKELI